MHFRWFIQDADKADVNQTWPLSIIYLSIYLPTYQSSLYQSSRYGLGLFLLIKYCEALERDYEGNCSWLFVIYFIDSEAVFLSPVLLIPVCTS